MITIFDVETTTFTRPDGSRDFTPFHPANRLVSVGWGRIYEGKYLPGDYYFFHHNKIKQDQEKNRAALQACLDNTTLLVAHNIKFDLCWILESGFSYDGPIYCTQVAGYILERGLKGQGLGLDDLAAKYGTFRKLKGLVDWELGTDNIDPAILQEYGEGDIQAAGELYLALEEEYSFNSSGLNNVKNMAMEFTRVITEIEQNGIKIDVEELDKVAEDYQEERRKLKERLQEIVHEVMGDTPINLASPEQLSQVIYSRRVLDKAEWKSIFNIGKDIRGKDLPRPKMSPTEFAKQVKKNVVRLRKTKARQCPDCKGAGMVTLLRKNGEPRAKPNICHPCGRTGVVYDEIPQWAGLKFSPSGVQDCAVGGFSTDKEALTRLKVKADVEGDKLASEFLGGCIRLNAIDTYLDSFVGGIRRGILPNEVIHPSLNQTITSTQRLSSSNPNFQNMPREKTFPIRRAIASRFQGGEIWEVDFAALEFRVAGELADDPVIRDMIAKGIDAHKKTATIIYGIPVSAVSKDQRQDSKAHTFAPLYGAMGFGYPEHIRKYYQDFTKVYPGIGRWHRRLQDEAINMKKIVLPDGKEFAFPFSKRTATGGSTHATQIKNYGVQYAATGCIVPLFTILLRDNMKKLNLQSLMINEVHDSVVFDVPPEEDRDKLKQAIWEAKDNIPKELMRRFNWEFKMPLEVEVKGGPNALDTKVISLDTFPADDIPF